MAVVLNQLNRYACTVCLKVTVLEEDGMPSADTQVHFEVMNYACFGEIADVRTGDDGACTLETGLGTLLVTACKNGSCGEALVHTQEQTECTLRLGGAQEKENIWEKMMIFAPKDAPVNRFSQSPEEIAEGRRKCEAASAIRRERENSFYDEDMAEKAAAGFSAADQERCRRIMKLAGGNQKEIAGFLARPANGMYRERRKLDLLESLREKDYLDITADLLEENARYASAFEGSYPEEIFISCILCPRVENEMIRSYRTFISRWLNDEEKEYMKKQPSLVWKKVKETLRSDETLEYGNLITSAEGALTGGWGSVLTQKVVTVQILRTLGIAARLNPADGRPEIWRDGCFVTLEKESGRTAGIILQKQPEIPWTYFQNWTIARFENGAYRTLQMCVENTEGEVMLLPGRYRMLTANRLPNGNIFAEKMVFELLPGEKRTITPKLYEAQPRDLLEENDIADFSLKTPDGKEHRVSELVREKKGLFIWLEENREPTEHILNEIRERKEEFQQAEAGLYFVVSDLQTMKNQTVQKTAAAVEGIHFLLDDFGADMEILARRMYLEPGKLPLIVIIDENMTGRYGVAGYNVGTADMILKILKNRCFCL